MKFALKTLALLLAVGTAPPVLAATWTVQRDGSGDFSVIQDAIDAADPGDTILIGPGRYDTFHAQTSTVDNFPFAAICWVAKADLTIVGAGRDVTFLGPAACTSMEEQPGRPSRACSWTIRRASSPSGTSRSSRTAGSTGCH